MIKICDGKPDDGIVRVLSDQLQKSSPRRSRDGDHRVSGMQSCIGRQSSIIAHCFFRGAIFLGRSSIGKVTHTRKGYPHACHFERGREEERALEAPQILNQNGADLLRVWGRASGEYLILKKL